MSGSWFAPQLDHGSAVNGCVQAAVSAAVQSVADRSAAGFAGAGWYRCGSGEAGEPGLGEASDVADFEQDLGGGAGGDAGNGGQGRSTLPDEFGKFDFGGFVLGQQWGPSCGSMGRC